MILLLMLAVGGYLFFMGGAKQITFKERSTGHLAAPHLERIIALSDQAVALSWRNLAPEAEAIIIYRQQPQGAFQTIDTVSASDTTYVDTNLTYGMAYTYALSAMVGGRQSSLSNQLQGTTKPPAEPLNFRAVLAGPRMVKLTWVDSCNFEKGYELQRKVEGVYKTIIRLPPNTTAFIDTIPPGVHNLTYRLRTFTAKHYSSFVNTQAACAPPAALNITSPDDETIILTWRNLCGLATGYKIERKTGSSGFQIIAQFRAGVNRYVDRGLKHGVKYDYRVSTLSPGGVSEPVYVSGQTYFPRPKDLRARVLNDSQILLRWSEDCPFERGFLVERKSGTGKFTVIKRLPANARKYKDTGLKFGITYEYRIVAYTSNNRSEPSNTISVKTVLPRPTKLTAKALDDTRIRLSWSDNCTFETGYVVERKDDQGKFKVVGSVKSDVTRFVDTGLRYGTKYTYRVKTRTANNFSKASTEVSLSTIFPPPAELTAKALDDSRVVIAWKEQTTFETGFIIQRKESGGRFKTIGKVKANVTKVVDKGLSYRKLYFYRVAAITSHNVSGFSNIVSVQTFFPSPTSLRINKVSDNSVKLTWKDKCSFESGYLVERRLEGESFKVVARLKANSKQFIDHDLDPTLVYYWRVAAFTKQNVSDYVGPKPYRIVPLEFVLIPGERVGSTKKYAFSITKYEITNRQYARFLEEALKQKKIRMKQKKLEFHYKGDKRWKKGWYPVLDLADPDVHIHFLNGRFRVESQYADHPVTEVPWFGAFAFAEFYHCRLPTEEEWEAVALGTKGAIYPWGDDIDSSRANYWNSKDPWDNGTTPVGFYDGKIHRGFATRNSSSSDGAYDLAGNVWEWTNSFWSDESKMRVLRGGSWHDGPEAITITSRQAEDPRHASRYVGFRVLHEPVAPKTNKRRK